MTPDLRRFVLAGDPVGPADLMREHRLSYHDACRALEDLESDRLVGRQVIGGLPRWSPAFAVDEGRVAKLRKLHGKALYLTNPAGSAGLLDTLSPSSKPLSRALVRRHVEERHPGTIARCARCRR